MQAVAGVRALHLVLLAVELVVGLAGVCRVPVLHSLICRGLAGEGARYRVVAGPVVEAVVVAVVGNRYSVREARGAGQLPDVDERAVVACPGDLLPVLDG